MAIPCSETYEQKHCRLHVLLWMVSLSSANRWGNWGTESQSNSLTCQAIAQFGLSIRETNAMQTDLFFLTLPVSLSAKLLFLAIELCVSHESNNKKNWRAVKQSLGVSSERYWGLPAVSHKSFREPCVLKSAFPLLRESWVLYTSCGVWIAPEIPSAEYKYGLFALHKKIGCCVQFWKGRCCAQTIRTYLLAFPNLWDESSKINGKTVIDPCCGLADAMTSVKYPDFF